MFLFVFMEYLIEGLMKIYKIDVFFYEWVQNWLFDLLLKKYNFFICNCLELLNFKCFQF